METRYDWVFPSKTNPNRKSQFSYVTMGGEKEILDSYYKKHCVYSDLTQKEKEHIQWHYHQLYKLLGEAYGVLGNGIDGRGRIR